MSGMEQSPPHRPDGPPADEVGVLEGRLTDLWQRSRSSARERARAVHPRLDATAFPLLVVLGRHGPARPSDLGARLYLDRSTVTRQVDALERLGLVVRRPDPTDARARLVELTDQARTSLAQAQEERSARWRRSLGEWDPADLARLSDLLRRLAEADVW